MGLNSVFHVGRRLQIDGSVHGSAPAFLTLHLVSVLDGFPEH